MGCLLQTLRVGLIQHCLPPVTYTIMDSFPIPLCQSIRNHRAKILRPVANISYNATKRQWFYGLKGHFQVTNQGIVVAYSISTASIHDIRLVPELIDQYACPHVLADVGYLSQSLKTYLKQRHIDFWTPKRRNMVQSELDNTLLKRQRRKIETLFSEWQILFKVEHNRGRCRRGFKSRLEQLLFVDTWKRINQHNGYFYIIRRLRFCYFRGSMNNEKQKIRVSYIGKCNFNCHIYTNKRGFCRYYPVKTN